MYLGLYNGRRPCEWLCVGTSDEGSFPLRNVAEKAGFEKVMVRVGHTIKHYHADNGHFAHNGFIDTVNERDQSISYCNIGTHHQNGIIENRNKILMLGACTLLMHGIKMWPQMIDYMFWTFSMKSVAERLNGLQIDTEDRTPELILHEVGVKDLPPKSYHTIFCPVYVLDAQL